MPTDTGNHALFLMEENHLTQLPLVVDNVYTALVQENDVLDWGTPERPLSGADFLNFRPAVMANGHPYDALRIAYSQKLSVVPVVGKESEYMGAITRDDLLKYITENSGLDNPGGILVLEMDLRDYSLWDIARICESEEILIISSQVHTNKETGKLEVTIKTNRTDLSGLVQSFERHNYNVREVYGDTDIRDDMLTRYNLLMNFINM